MASEKTVQIQIDNWNNSKQGGAEPANRRIVVALVTGIALFVLGAACVMPPPLSGRLHPAHVPAAIAVVALAAVLVCILRPEASRDSSDVDCLPSAWTSPRGIACAIAAVIIMALGARSMGIPPTVLAAGAAAALGVRGVGVAQACVIGAVLSAIAALVFVVLLRQPLPLLPGLW
jgi:drug/metabolite transporter (DMT)-like permease